MPKNRERQRANKKKFKSGYKSVGQRAGDSVGAAVEQRPVKQPLAKQGIVPIKPDH